MAELNSYELSRKWFDWCFENPEKISPNHAAIYFFAIEHCNRLGWRSKFGFPTQMVMDAVGIKKHQTYIKYFNDLVEWGFFDLVQKSQNQYSANIISLISAKPKSGKALDKAIINHAAKQTETIGQSNSSIIKPDNHITINNITINQFFIDFENGSHIVEMARTQKTTPETLKAFIPFFKTKANSEYPSYGKFVDHFRNTWLLNKDKVNLTKPKGGKVLE
jgi:hypothetical protein